MLGVILCCLVLATPAGAAPDQVLVLHVDDAPATGLVEALRIQLAGAAVVTLGGRLEGDSIAARVEAAGEKVAAPVKLVVWLEPSGDDVVLYAVGRGGERALVDAFRQPATGGPEAERAFALKVREVLDQLALAPSADEPREVGSRASAPPVREPTPAPASSRIGAEMELAARAVLGSPGGQLGAGLGLAGGVRRGRMQTDVYVFGYLATGVRASMDEAAVDTRELGAGGGARASWRVGAVAAGGGFELTGRRVRADGAIEAGPAAGRTVWLATATPLGELRYQLGDGVALRAALGVDLALTRQRFSVNEVTILDLGRTRARMDLSVILRLR